MLMSVQVPAAMICCGVLWPPLGSAQDRVNNALVYELIDRLNALERELRLLRNDFEEFQYRERRDTGDRNADDRVTVEGNAVGYADLEQRLSALERALGAASAPRLPQDQRQEPGFNADSDRTQSPYQEPGRESEQCTIDN